MTDFQLPGCPFTLSVHVGKCPEKPWQPEPRKRLVVGSTIPLTVEWSAPDNWLARFSEWLVGLLYGIGIGWSGQWGRWRLDSLETKAEVIQDREGWFEVRLLPGVPPQGGGGIFAEIEGLDD